MATTNHERVGKAMELLRDGLAPFVRREVTAKMQAGTLHRDTIRHFAEDRRLAHKPFGEWDAAALLKLMWDTWNDVFRETLGFTEHDLSGFSAHKPSAFGRLWKDVDEAGEVVAGDEDEKVRGGVGELYGEAADAGKEAAWLLGVLAQAGRSKRRPAAGTERVRSRQADRTDDVLEKPDKCTCYQHGAPAVVARLTRLR